MTSLFVIYRFTVGKEVSVSVIVMEKAVGGRGEELTETSWSFTTARGVAILSRQLVCGTQERATAAEPYGHVEESRPSPTQNLR
jgi:hypothetical protein